MADLRLFGSTSNLVRFTLKDKTTGQGKTGLSSSTAGLVISTIADNEAAATAYTQAGGTVESITTLGTYATPTATKCRFKEVDATNHKGLYEFQFADARFAVSSSKRLVISVNDGESTLLDADYEIELVQFNPFDAAALGLSRLDAAVSSRMATFTLPSNFASLGITAGGAVTVGTNNDKTGYSLTQSFPANFASFAITAGGAVTAGTVSDKTGYSLAAAGLDSVTVESGLNARQALSIIASASGGVLAGAATTSITIAGAGVATNRITATVDANGNRSAVALNPPA